MQQFLSRLAFFVGFLFMVVLATAAPVLAAAVLTGLSAFALAEFCTRQEPEPRRVSLQRQEPASGS